jgi:NAD(P)-dependent dehydrogenase (short-subunit alcohol dehydrogenase family)
MQEKVLAEISAIRGQTYEELEAARLAQVPLKRTAPPEEMAGLIRFLLSDDSAYMTGQAINFDGGLVMT